MQAKHCFWQLSVFFLIAREVEGELLSMHLLLQLRKKLLDEPTDMLLLVKIFPQKFLSKMDTQFFWQLKRLWVAARMAGQ